MPPCGAPYDQLPLRHTIAYSDHDGTPHADPDALSAGAGDQRGHAGGLHPADSDGFPLRHSLVARATAADGTATRCDP